MRMVSGRKWMLAVALSAAAVPFAGVPAGAQPAPIHHRALRRAAQVDPERAAELRARAGALMKDRSRFREAAALLERSSALTPVEDSARAHDLYVAANLLFYVGSLRSAEELMAESADAALERGDVEAAADALVNAGLLAAKRNNAAEAREFGLRALHLAASPLISPSLRDRIRERVVVSPPEPPARGTAASRARAARGTGFSVAAEHALSGRTRVPGRAAASGR